jgi:hypothetical protein
MISWSSSRSATGFIFDRNSILILRVLVLVMLVGQCANCLPIPGEPMQCATMCSHFRRPQFQLFKLVWVTRERYVLHGHGAFLGF